MSLRRITVILHCVPYYRRIWFDELVKKGFEINFYFDPSFYSSIYGRVESNLGGHTDLNEIRIFRFLGLQFFFRRVKFSENVILNGNLRFIPSLFIIALRVLGVINSRIFWLGQLRSRRGSYFSQVALGIRVFFISKCDGAIFYTKSEMQEYLSFRNSVHGASGKYITYLNNGGAIAEIYRFSQRQPYMPEYPVIGVIGRVSPKYSLDQLSEFIYFIQSKSPCAKFEVVSSNFDLAMFAERFSNNNRIKLYVDVKSPQAIAELAKTWTHSFYPGAIGLAACDSFALGLPLMVVNDSSFQHFPEIEIYDSHKDKLFLTESIVEAVVDQWLSAERFEAEAEIINDWSVLSAADRFSDLVR